MLDLLHDAIRRHRGTGILVDTNLLLVLFLAAWNRQVALAFKRTNGYTEDDLLVLATILEQFQRVIVCSSVMAEMSNLAGQLGEPRRSEFFAFLAEQLRLPLYDERVLSITTAAAASGFVRLGFTDATIEELARAGALVLTDDFPLYAHLLDCGAEAFNFTHVRGLLTL
jgi:hypothetical protein